jgi:hypothetical protein
VSHDAGAYHARRLLRLKSDKCVESHARARNGMCPVWVVAPRHAEQQGRPNGVHDRANCVWVAEEPPSGHRGVRGDVGAACKTLAVLGTPLFEFIWVQNWCAAAHRRRAIIELSGCTGHASSMSSQTACMMTAAHLLRKTFACTCSKSAKYDATTKSTDPNVYCTDAFHTTLRGLKHHHFVRLSRRYDVLVHGS